MTAAQQLDLGPVRGHLDQQCRHELLGVQLTGQPQLDAFRDPLQVGRIVRHLAESAQHGRRRLDRDQALALDVADDDPAAVQRVHHPVQVTADLRPRRGRHVAHGEPDRADLMRNRSEQHLLGHLRDGPDLGQFLLPALPHGGGDDRGHGHAHDRGRVARVATQVPMTWSAASAAQTSSATTPAISVLRSPPDTAASAGPMASSGSTSASGPDTTAAMATAAMMANGSASRPRCTAERQAAPASADVTCPALPRAAGPGRCTLNNPVVPRKIAVPPNTATPAPRQMRR